MRRWIIARIQEISQLADAARAIAYDIEDAAPLDATTRLAEDIDAFAARLAS